MAQKHANTLSSPQDLLEYALPGQQPHILLLYALAMTLTPRSYLEIGTYRGATAGAVALAAEHGKFPCTIRCVEKEPKPELQDVMARFQNIDLYVQDSKDGIPEGPYDLALIDGGHSISTCWKDWLQVKEQMTQTGIVLIHDTMLYTGPYITERRIRTYDPDWSVANIRTFPGIAILSRNLKLTPYSMLLDEYDGEAK